MSALPIEMTPADAARITQKIKLRLETIADNTEAVIDLIEQAKAGNAHAALGFESWTAYVAETFGGSLRRLERAERAPIVEMLADIGMSTRAIAPLVGVSHQTVANDLNDAGVKGVDTCAPFACGGDHCWHEPVCRRVAEGEPKKITGRDGKTYVRPATYLRTGKPDAKSTEDIASAVPAVKHKPRRRALPDQYRNALFDAERALARLAKLQLDDRFPRIAEDPARLQHVTLLMERLTQIMEPHLEAVERGVADVDA